jgi:hypothetical protein
MRGNAHQTGVSEDAAGRFGRQIFPAEVDTVAAGGETDVRAVIDDETYTRAGGGANGAGLREEFAAASLLVAELEERGSGRGELGGEGRDTAGRVGAGEECRVNDGIEAREFEAAQAALLSASCPCRSGA